MIYVRDFLTDQSIYSSPGANPNPTVSVILPTYRRCKEGLLGRAINSVLAQRFKDFELLVMDDGSTDGSSALIGRFRERDARVIHVRHERNCGLPGLRVNEGIELARGRYLAFQFDDDMWRESALEDLVGAAERQPEPSVVVGRAQYNSRMGKVIIPSKEVDLVSLYESNRFANNSVLLPRCLVEQYGMYDPHIGMRRLTDWDLWLRLMRQAPFILLKQVVSDVFEANPGSIGLTVPWDESLFRYLHSIPRDHLLTPQTWRDYVVDALRIGAVDIAQEFRRRLYEEQIVPFYLQRRHFFPALGSFTATLPQSGTKTLLYAKQTYDVCNEVTIAHYDDLANRRGSYKSYYQVLDEVGVDWPVEADLALLMRTVEDEALDLVSEGLRAGKPVGLYLDDDLFSFHEYGDRFDYLAPGKPLYNNLVEITSQVDAVLVTNDFIRDSVQPYNPRVIPHNNTIPGKWLPDQVRPRAGRQLRIAYVGSDYRIEEFRLLWDALLRISKEEGDRLVFEFWGLDVSSLPPLSSPVTQKSFTFSYFNYLAALGRANFDILLTPLLDSPRPRLAKSLIKYYETAVAGALGIFSDVPQYRELQDGLTCLKAANDAESWYQALRKAIDMPPQHFDRLRLCCLEHVREEYSVQAQIDLHEAALRALEFHARTRQLRHADGCPRVMYVLHSAHYGGAEIQLWRRLRLAKEYGIQPVVVIPDVLKDSENGLRLKEALAQEGIQLEAVEYHCFTEPLSPADFDSERERSQIRELIQRCAPALVHTVTFIPSFGQVCQEMKIPHVNTLYAVQDDFAWGEDRPQFVHCSVVQSDCLRYANRWGQLLDAPWICSRDMAPRSLFLLGQTNYLQRLHSAGQPVAAGITPAAFSEPGDGGNAPGASSSLRLVVTGTFQERKQQLETIQAAGRLKGEGWSFQLSFYGYTQFFPEYVDRCRSAITSLGLQDCVFIRDFDEDIARVLAQADVLLSLSTYESFPGSIKDALAAGLLVVATPVGGVSELIIDQVSGILCNGTSVDDLVDGIRRALALPAGALAAMAEQGRRVGRLEMHPYRAANDLFRMYNLALETNGYRPGLALDRVPAAASPGAGVFQSRRSTRTRLRLPADHPASLMPLGAGVSYSLAPGQPDWNGIDVLLEAHGRPVTGQLSLVVRAPGGDLLRVSSGETKNLRQSGWVSLRFPAIRNSAGQRFRLEFSFTSVNPGAVVSLYQDSPPRRRALRLVQRLLRQARFRLRGGRLHCRLSYALAHELSPGSDRDEAQAVAVQGASPLSDARVKGA